MMPLWSRIAANKSVQTVTHGDAADATCGFGAGDCVATGAGGGAAGDGAAICVWATGGSAGGRGAAGGEGGGDGAGGNHIGAPGAA